jgi:hypothetical protein
MILKVALPIVIMTLLGSAASAGAQQPPVGAQQPSEPPLSVSVDRVRAGLQRPQPITLNGVSILAGIKPDEVQWGILTFVPPTTPGAFVSVRVPVGELVSHAAHSIAAAHHRRAESAAHADVLKALAEFQASQGR